MKRASDILVTVLVAVVAFLTAVLCALIIRISAIEGRIEEVSQPAAVIDSQTKEAVVTMCSNVGEYCHWCLRFDMLQELPYLDYLVETGYMTAEEKNTWKAMYGLD